MLEAFLFLALLPCFVGTQNNEIDLGDFSDFGDLRECGRACLSNVGTFVGCASNECLCNEDAGISFVQTCAITSCSSSSADVSSATSFLGAYCSSYLGAVSAATITTNRGSTISN